MIRFLRHFSLILIILLINVLLHYYSEALDLKVIHNSAFIFGAFEEASASVRIVFTSVFAGIVTLLACYFYAFLPRELKFLRWGITFFLAGVLGNTAEKLYYGYVWDFININIGPFSNYYFNLNDTVQIIGLLIITRELFNKQDLIWFPESKRRGSSAILYKEVQIPFMGKLLGLFIIGSLIQCILTVAMLFPLIESSDDSKLSYILYIFLLNLLLLPLIGRFLLSELLRSLGPVYALEKFLKERNYENELRFRKNDHFKSLEIAFNDFVKATKKAE